jgi:bisphosphoglycerate-dependent phosphoglycerate mutase
VNEKPYRAWELIRNADAEPGIVHTSVLQHSSRRTAEIVLAVLQRSWSPMRRSWRPSERQYRAQTELSKNSVRRRV